MSKLAQITLAHLPRLAADKTSRVPETILLAEVAHLIPSRTDGTPTKRTHGYVAIRSEDGAPAYLIAPTGRIVGEKVGTHDKDTVAAWYAMGTPVDYAASRQAHAAVATAEAVSEVWDADGPAAVAVLTTIDRAIRSKVAGFSRPDAILKKLQDAHDEDETTLETALAAFESDLIAANRKANSKPETAPTHKPVEVKALEALRSLAATLQEGKAQPDPQVLADLSTLMRAMLEALETPKAA